MVRAGCGGRRSGMSRHALLSKKRISIVFAAAAACAPGGKNGAQATGPASAAAGPERDAEQEGGERATPEHRDPHSGPFCGPVVDKGPGSEAGRQVATLPVRPQRGEV